MKTLKKNIHKILFKGKISNIKDFNVFNIEEFDIDGFIAMQMIYHGSAKPEDEVKKYKRGDEIRS